MVLRDFTQKWGQPWSCILSPHLVLEFNFKSIRTESAHCVFPSESELSGACFRSVPWSACSWGLAPRPHPSYASTFWVSHIPALIHTLIKIYFSFSWKLSCLETNSFFMTRYEFIRRAINIKKFFMTHYEFIWGTINTKISSTKENYLRPWACKAYLVKIYFLIFYKI